MKEIILDATLVVNELLPFNEFNPHHFFKDNKDFQPVVIIDSEIYHRNYLDYLSLCWKNHYGVVISPTILWNIVLNNLAFQVNKNPQVFQKYFTTSDEKQEIIIMQGGNLISPQLLINAVSEKIPSNMLQHVFPSYTTDDDKAVIANYTAFLDMVSPYYNYTMYLCGIPKVRVLGTYKDWYTFAQECENIATIIPEFKDYLTTVMSRVLAIANDICNYKKMFSLERCGSGSQVEVGGWIQDLFIEIPSVNYPENFISCIAKIDYHCYNDDRDYRMYAGLFTSIIEDDYLIPAFDNMYFLKNNK